MIMFVFTVLTVLAKLAFTEERPPATNDSLELAAAVVFELAVRPAASVLPVFALWFETARPG